MNQIDIILKHFKEWHPYAGIEYLWYSCDGEMDDENYPDVKFEFDPDTAFFMALERLKEIWIGKEKMDKLDEEHGYLGWYFLSICPYSLTQKMFDEDGNFLRWYVN